MTISPQYRSRVSRILIQAVKSVPALVIALACGTAAPAQTYRIQILHTFHGTDGAIPAYGNLIQDSKGNLYGATQQGGRIGSGTIFKLDASGKETVLHSFTTSPDGYFPNASLVRDAAGNLYGTTYYGGAQTYGTIFKVDKSDKETVLFSFNDTDGAHPQGGLVMDTSGNFYGTTVYGDDANCGQQGCGVVFKLDAAGNETALHAFIGPDGSSPFGTLVLDGSGNLYGTTQEGGTGSCPGYYCGTVFRMEPNGNETVLHNFRDVEGDGSFPQAGLVRDAKGNLYGTTYYGGGSDVGTVFKVTSKGKETVLHNFSGAPGGAYPYANLVLDSKGNLYGTTFQGGPSNDGIVFKIAPSGKETTLHAFSGSDGAYPEAGLLLDKKGNFYGTTTEGGDFSCNRPYGCGVVFKLVPQ